MSKTILLADDSVTIRKVVELTFMEEDYELVSLGSGEEAVDELPKINPDLVIADVHMPGVDGYEVCRQAKALRPERPVLLLVGTFEPFDPASIEASGADGHLKKPFDSQELLQRVRNLLDGGEELRAAGTSVPEEPIEESAEAAPAPQPAGDQTVPVPAPEETAASDTGSDQEETAPEQDAEAEELEEAEPATEAEAEVETTSNGELELSQEAIDRIARRVAEILGPEILKDVAWEVVPDLAEVVIKERLRELESQVE